MILVIVHERHFAVTCWFVALHTSPQQRFRLRPWQNLLHNILLLKNYSKCWQEFSKLNFFRMTETRPRILYFFLQLLILLPCKVNYLAPILLEMIIDFIHSHTYTHSVFINQDLEETKSIWPRKFPTDLRVTQSISSSIFHFVPSDH